MPNETAFAYDKVPYPSFLHSQTHPDRLATFATFLGMKPAPPENCRVLELGCGNGSSLLAMAYGLPQSKFVGVDLSEVQINHGNSVVTELGLKNLELKQADIMNISRETFGEFDYIIAHGVFSWVPDFVRDQILVIYREMLAKNGVGFVSYNAFPGFYFRQVTRDLMEFQTKDIETPIEKVNKGISFLKFVGEYSTSNPPYQKVMQDELEKAIEREPENIFHDDLSEQNKGYYFHEFVSAAEKHDLQFLSEAEYFSNQDINFAPKVRDFLRSFGDDVVQREQYIDFLEGRRFRQTLLVHKDVKLNRNPTGEILEKFRLASSAKAVSKTVKFASNDDEKFIGEKKTNFYMSHPLTKAVLQVLGKSWSHSLEFGEVKRLAIELLQQEKKNFDPTVEDYQTLVDIFVQLLGTGLIEFHIHEPKYTLEVNEKPLASALARWQAKKSESVFSLRYQNLKIEDDLGRNLIILLDGTRDLNDLTKEIKSLIEKKVIATKFPNHVEKLKFLSNLPNMLKDNLQEMARLALLEE